MTTCVLISTCEKYRALAEFTRARLSEYWPDLPPVRFAGLESHAEALPLRDDPRDWMKVTRSACDDMLAEGAEFAYVLLDDHPPLGPCDARRLNDELPAMMRELDAVSVALSGFGQGRKRFGTAVRWRDWNLDLCLPTTLWKFPLHPALWRLEALREILDRLIARLPEEEHTPWAFERKGGAPDSGLPENLIARSYRIDGRDNAAAPYPPGLTALRAVTDVFRLAVKTVGGANARAAVDQRLLGVHHYYHGPYPLFWSGLMRKGRVNSDALYFLRLTGRDGWEEAVRYLPRE